MPASSTSFRIAQAVGLSGAAWLSGNIAALSLISVPALSKSHKEDSVPAGYLARQWKHTFEAGKSQNPPIAGVATASFAYLAWSVRAGTSLSLLVPKNSIILYSVAAVFTIGIVPWTIIAMMPTNNKLLAKAEHSASVMADDKEVSDLLRKWTILNGVRSLLPLAGTAVALAAVLV